jgi:hypothetical protein
MANLVPCEPRIRKRDKCEYDSGSNSQSSHRGSPVLSAVGNFDPKITSDANSPMR